MIVSSVSTNVQRPNFSIQDPPGSDFFTVTMTALTVRDSGRYFCGIIENDRTIAVLRRFLLVVSRGELPPTMWLSAFLIPGSRVGENSRNCVF